MAISLITAAASTLTDGASDPGLISQLNTALAPLLSDNIRGVSFVTQGDDRLIGNELQVAITYDTLGSAISNPYVAAGFQAKSIEGVKTAMLAYLAAHPSYFFSTAWIQAIPQARQGSQYVGLIFYNTNAAEGALNWAVNGGGSIGSQYQGHIVTVDAVIGDDAAAATAPYAIPFLTIQAAINAATSGDSLVIRPGTYTSVATIVLKDGVNIRCEPGVVISVTGNFKAIFGDATDPFGGGGAGTVVNCRITGHAKILSIGHQIALALRAASTVTLECDEIALGTAGIPIYFSETVAVKTVVIRVLGFARCGAGIITDASGAGSTISFSADHIQADGAAVVESNGGSNIEVVAREIRCPNQALAGSGLVYITGGSATISISAMLAVVTTTSAITAPNAGATIRLRIEYLSCSGRLITDTSIAGFNTFVVDITEDLLVGGDSAIFNSGAFGGIYTFRVGRIFTCDGGTLVNVAGGFCTVDIEAGQLIRAAALIMDQTSNAGPMIVSMRAPELLATGGGSYGFNLGGGTSGSRWDIRADKVTSNVRLQGFDLTCELHLHVGTMYGQNAATRTLDTVSGKVFVTADEINGSGLGVGPAVNCRAGETHIMRGRLLGADGDPTGHALAINDAADVKVYPGVILVAGSDAGAFSIGLAVGGVTPTANLMGAIAANKAAEAGVVVAVGSLLVDAAVN